MTEEEWLTSDRAESLLYGLCDLKYSSARVPAYVASFAEGGRARQLLSPEMQIAFDDYVRWAHEGGPSPATLYPQWTVFDPLDRQIIDAWDVAHDLRSLIGLPLGSWDWWAASSFVMAEAYNLPIVSQWRRQPTPDTPALLRSAVVRLRDVVGNPFRPVTFDPAWRTDTALALARQMYESRDFSAMPILADALQDAGCDNTDVLNHCRGDGPHVRGCWVVDLVLGKE
jgi:hypothetical protein